MAAKKGKANGAKKGSSKPKAVNRTRMTDDQVDSYLKKYAKERDLKGAEFQRAKDRCAATRWAALERNAKKAKK